MQDDDRVLGRVALNSSEPSIDLSVRHFCGSRFALSAGLLSEEPAGRLRGYFFHPVVLRPGVKHYSAVRPVRRLRLRYCGVEDRRELLLDNHLPAEASGYDCVDAHLGLLVLQRPADKGPPALVVWDPASGDYAVLPPPPADALQQNGGFILNDADDTIRENPGAVILSRKEGEALEFEVAFLTMVKESTLLKPEASLVTPKAWIATYDGHNCRWESAPLPSNVRMEEPVLIDRYCVRAAGKLFWHTHGIGVVNQTVVSLDPVRKTFGRGTMPKPKNRLGQDSSGKLIAGAVGNHECLYLSVAKKGRDWKWSKLPHLYLSEDLDRIPELATRSRRVTHMTDFDQGCPGSILIKTSGNGKYRYQIGTGDLERLITPDGMEWGHPIFPYSF